MPQVMCTVFVPVDFNDKTPIPADLLQKSREVIGRLAPGGIAYPLSEGWWIKGNEEFLDRGIPIQILMTRTVDMYDRLRATGRTLATILQQQCVFFCLTPTKSLEIDGSHWCEVSAAANGR